MAAVAWTACIDLKLPEPRQKLLALDSLRVGPRHRHRALTFVCDEATREPVVACSHVS